jgi:hypothetical protein
MNPGRVKQSMQPYIAFVALHHPPHSCPRHNNPHHTTSRLAIATCRDKREITHTFKGSGAFVVESRVKDGFQMNVERTNPSGVGKLRERRAAVGKTGEEEVRERRQKGGGGGDSVDAPIALA